MTRIMDRLVDAWDWFRRVTGLDRVSRAKRAADYEGHSRLWRVFYWGRPVLALLVIGYFVMLTSRFSVIHGDALDFPQQVLPATVGPAPGSPLPEGGCAPSQVAAMTAHIVDILVNSNTWVPGDPQYKIGWFGIAGFDGGPFFDNKASFQVGAMRAARRVGVELVDLLGRARGTSAANVNLQDARGALQWNETQWTLNPFDARNPLIGSSAASQYRTAIARLQAFNVELSACTALYDVRPDNLYQLLDRIANDTGGMTDQLATRSKGDRWDVPSKQLVPADGNNLGFFDFRADNLFFEAHGMMWAYHGILQAIRADFDGVIRGANLDQIWDRMEAHVAEAASLEPLIVSNGREDSIFTPDHLSAMAANMLRARANMTEIREVLAR